MIWKLFNRKRRISKEIKELEYPKSKLASVIDEQFKTAESDLRELLALDKVFKSHNDDRFDSLVSLSIHTSILGTDIFILLEKYRLTNREVERRFHARLLAMIIFEYWQEIGKHVGSLRRDLKKLQYDNHVRDIEQINKQFSSLGKQNEALIKDLRNNTAAHRTTNGVHLANLILSFNPDDIYTLGLSVVEINRQLTDKTTQLFDQIVSDMKNFSYSLISTHPRH